MYKHFSKLFFSIESFLNSTKNFIVYIQNVLNKICEEKKRNKKPKLEGEELIEYNKVFKK